MAHDPRSAPDGEVRQDPPSRRTLSRLAWGLAIALVAALLAKTFIGDVYHVDSGSMEPTIFGSPQGGEHVFVRYDRSAPERFECAVVQRPGEDAPVVKRIVARGGESVQISQGDLLINNARLAPHVPRPPPIPVFDDRWQKVEEFFRMGSSQSNPWTAADGVWKVDARLIALNADAGLMFWHRPLRDDYLAPDHSIVTGTQPVNDAVVACEVRTEDGEGRIRLSLLEQGDTFEAQIAFGMPDGNGTRPPAEARIIRRNREPEQELAKTTIELVPGRWYRLRLANIDNALTLDVDDARGLLTATYKENPFHPNDLLKEGKSFGDRVRIGGEGAQLSFRAIRVFRDLHYTQRGQYGIATALDLDPGEFFALGDNSAASRDSREWGPVRLSEIVGRPAAVVWPPARWRAIESIAPIAMRQRTAGEARAASEPPSAASSVR